ncbi:hypothetical protein LRP88_09328 [Fusarium phalaenopsidis]
MPDKKNKKSPKHQRKTHGHQSGELPRDAQVDQRKFEELQRLVYEREALDTRHEHLIWSLATRRSGNQHAEELYGVLSHVDFQQIRGLSSSANAARERRGVPHGSKKKRQTEEISSEDRFYQDWNRALAMQQGIESIPQSLEQFAEDERQLVRDIAASQRELADLTKRIYELQVWLSFYIGDYLDSSYFQQGPGRDGDNGGGASGQSTLETGEEIYEAQYYA